MCYTVLLVDKHKTWDRVAHRTCYTNTLENKSSLLGLSSYRAWNKIKWNFICVINFLPNGLVICEYDIPPVDFRFSQIAYDAFCPVIAAQNLRGVQEFVKGWWVHPSPPHKWHPTRIVKSSLAIVIVNTRVSRIQEIGSGKGNYQWKMLDESYNVNTCYIL